MLINFLQIQKYCHVGRNTYQFYCVTKIFSPQRPIPFNWKYRFFGAYRSSFSNAPHSRLRRNSHSLSHVRTKTRSHVRIGKSHDLQWRERFIRANGERGKFRSEFIFVYPICWIRLSALSPKFLYKRRSAILKKV